MIFFNRENSTLDKEMSPSVKSSTKSLRPKSVTSVKAAASSTSIRSEAKDLSGDEKKSIKSMKSVQNSKVSVKAAAAADEESSDKEMPASVKASAKSLKSVKSLKNSEVSLRSEQKPIDDEETDDDMSGHYDIVGNYVKVKKSAASLRSGGSAVLLKGIFSLI